MFGIAILATTLLACCLIEHEARAAEGRRDMEDLATGEAVYRSALLLWSEQRRPATPSRPRRVGRG